MRLLFDENLSYKLVGFLASTYPESTHVRSVGLRGATDGEIWEFAKQRGFIIVSKDTDFRERSFAEGPPPKVIWLDVANEGTEEIWRLLELEYDRVERFNNQHESSLLILSLGAKAI